jgi:serine protease Do
MPFPFNITRSDPTFKKGLILCQHPDALQRILPLFQFSPHEQDKRVAGHGTAFRIDPWSRCLTAYHVLEDLFEINATNRIVLRDDIRLATLEVGDLVYGAPSIPPEAWRPIVECATQVAIHTPPLQLASLRNFLELIVLRIRPRIVCARGTPFLDLDLSSWHPKLGETVLALGFADLDKKDGDQPDDRPIDQSLYGSFGVITDVVKADGSRARPWPQIRVSTNWPGGMSGGPVFNEAGNVIGLVSAGFDGEGGASATYFSNWNAPERILGSVDPINPGWFRCIATFDAHGQLQQCGQDEPEIRRFAAERGFSDVGMISYNFSSGDYVRL